MRLASPAARRHDGGGGQGVGFVRRWLPLGLLLVAEPGPRSRGSGRFVSFLVVLVGSCGSWGGGDPSLSVVLR